MPVASNDPRIQKILEKSRLKREQEKLAASQNELSNDIMKFSQLQGETLDGRFKIPDLGVFDRIKLDAGASIDTELVTRPQSSSSFEGNNQEVKLAVSSKTAAADGPYFKIDEYGRKKLDLSKIVLKSKSGDSSIGKFEFKSISDRLYSRDELKTMKNESKKQETLGPKWFDMKAADITPEMKQDLMIIKNRAALDPKQFYKKETSTKVPKYFQVGLSSFLFESLGRLLLS